MDERDEGVELLSRLLTNEVWDELRVQGLAPPRHYEGSAALHCALQERVLKVLRGADLRVGDLLKG